MACSLEKVNRENKPAAVQVNSELQWEPLSSSHIEAMAYDGQNAEMLVRFKDGSVYRYSANLEEVEGMRNAESPGRYLRLMFRGRGSRL